jgi:protein-tyrosine phosphatase
VIDIHSHILWGLDDGAASPESSAEMLRIAARHGTTDIVASPHSNLQFGFDPELARTRLEELARQVTPAPRIHLGCDYHFYPESVAIAAAHPERYSINGKGYLLIEFSDLVIFKETPALLARLREAGLKPVLTHPERNWLLHPKVEELAAWVKEGLLLQITAQSLLGRFGKPAQRFAELLLNRGLVHFVASDAHDPEDRTPRLDEAFAWVARRYGPAAAEHLFVLNPGCALTGAPLPPQPAPPPPRKWYAFWRR